MADPFGDQDQDFSGKGKRPAQTIEGTATEISLEPANEEAARTEPGETKGEGANEREPLDETEAREPNDDAPPARASLPEIRSFVTHLAAGLLGGLVGVIALALAWGVPSGKPGNNAAELAKLDQRIAKIES